MTGRRSRRGRLAGFVGLAALFCGPLSIAAASPATVTIGVTSFTAGYETYPGPIAIDRANGVVYAALGEIGQVAVLRIASGRVLDVPVRGIPKAVAVNQKTGLAYVVGGASDLGGTQSSGVTVLRGTRVVAEFPLPLALAPSSVAVDQRTQRIYVTDAGSNRLTVIKGTHIVGTITVGPGPTALALDARSQDLYVADHGTNLVSVVHRGHVIATVKVAHYPVAIGVDPTTDRAYVVCRQSHKVVVMHGTRRVGVISTPKHSLPTSIAVLPQRHIVFVGEPGVPDDSGDENTYIASGYTVIHGAKRLQQVEVGMYDAVVTVSADPASSYVLVGILGNDHSQLVDPGAPSVTLPYYGAGPAVTGGGNVLWSSDGESSFERIEFHTAS